jgi:hypothetical protein
MRKLAAVVQMILMVSVASALSLMTAPVPAQAQAVPTLSVNAATGQHAINSNIYGMVGGAKLQLAPWFAATLKVPNVRWGGDGTSNYNWNYDTQNQGTDLYFLQGSNPTVVPGGQIDTMISGYRAAYSGVQPIVTIPINGYLVNSNASNCSYPQSLYPTQDAFFQPYSFPNCGNGSSGGVPIVNTTLNSVYLSNTPAIEEAWIAHLITTWGTCASGGVCLYQLDNEPGGWCNTHHDWQTATCASYATIASDGETYATAIKTADPSAKVMGPSDFLLWGWVLNSPTSDPACVYYLKQFAAYDGAHGKRTLDYLDEHYGVGDTSSTIQYDFDQVRSYWDPTYTYQNNVFGGPVEFIPRMQGYIASYYPGTLFSMSEYEVSHYPGQPQIGGSSVIDAMVLADALGVFGYYNLQLANLYDQINPGDAEAFTFLLYENYDGAGGHFGDTSVTSASTNQSELSVYGALRSSDGKLTVMVINKENTSYSTTLSLSGFTATSSALTYTYSSANTSAIVSGTASVSGGNSVSYTFPPYSATEFILTPTVAAAMPVPPTNLLATAQ